MEPHHFSDHNSDNGESDPIENPIVTLKSGVNVEDLIGGTEFEVNLDDIKKSGMVH